nr:putative u6 snrna-associated sm-like protein lsm4 [Quercus suber]
MLPLGLLTAAQGHPMLVELKNGETLNGHLVACDTYMNLTLKEVVQTSPDGDKFFRLPECYVRGNNIKYLRVPDEIVEIVKEQQAQHQHSGGHASRGRGGGAGGRRDSQSFEVWLRNVYLAYLKTTCIKQTFIATRREALLVGDYNSYRAQLSRQLLASRKRLGRATPKREKFAKKSVTAEDIGNNHEFAHLLLLTAERAWAHAMHIKTSHAAEDTGSGITGSTRSHIISRLNKASKTARELVGALQDAVSKANEQDWLEARAYQSSMAGGEEFEKQSGGQRSGDGKTGDSQWKKCLQHYSEARVIYAALHEKDKKDVYKDILANTIDPTIRYAAYQAHLSRTIAIPTVARRYFPKDDSKLVKLLESLDPYALQDKPQLKTDEGRGPLVQETPSSVTWRGRRANLVDASIGQALASVATAEARLRSYLSANATASTKDRAAAYDDVLIASGDAVDATKHATDELEKEKVDEGDSRMQDLRVTSLALNYDLVSWRVGRNRVLIGEHDGLILEPQDQRKSKRPRKDGTEYPEKEEPRGRKLARLRERTVLYDVTIQSISSIKDVRGAMRDDKFVNELDGSAGYFRALKCLNIAYSHVLLGNHLNALALLKKAEDLASADQFVSQDTDENAPLTLHISSAASEKLKAHISSQLSRTHAIVELQKLEENAAVAASKHMTSAAPLVQRLHEYPTPGTYVDVKNLVTYPPRIEAVPIKPLFYDLAWNYIDYPGRKPAVITRPQSAAEDVAMGNGVDEEPQQKKRGWFGFGRSERQVAEVNASHVVLSLKSDVSRNESEAYIHDGHDWNDLKYMMCPEHYQLNCIISVARRGWPVGNPTRCSPLAAQEAAHDGSGGTWEKDDRNSLRHGPLPAAAALRTNLP